MTTLKALKRPHKGANGPLAPQRGPTPKSKREGDRPVKRRKVSAPEAKTTGEDGNNGGEDEDAAAEPNQELEPVVEKPNLEAKKTFRYLVSSPIPPVGLALVLTSS